MSFKKLNLYDKEKLLQYIKDTFEVLDIKENKENQYNVKIKYENKEALLVFYFNQNGTTTINISQGKNKEINKIIADKIKKNCLISDKKNLSFSLTTDQLKDDEFKYMLEFLKDDFNCEINNENHNTYEIYKISRNNEKFTIKKYRTGTIQFQGKPINIYAKIMEYLSAIPEFSLENIIKIQTEVFEVPIEKNSIEEEFVTKFPNSNKFLCETTKKIIKSGIIQQKIDAPYPDYSPLTYPFLRSLECTLKKVWKEIFNENIPKQNGFKGKIKKDGTLEIEYKNKINQNLSDAIENSYKYYYYNRHGLFHSDENPDMTRIIEKREEALSIINRCNELIERLCYESIQNKNRSAQ
jgi:hypothetical protein